MYVQFMPCVYGVIQPQNCKNVKIYEKKYFTLFGNSEDLMKAFVVAKKINFVVYTLPFYDSLIYDSTYKGVTLFIAFEDARCMPWKISKIW